MREHEKIGFRSFIKMREHEKIGIENYKKIPYRKPRLFIIKQQCPGCPKQLLLICHHVPVTVASSGSSTLIFLKCLKYGWTVLTSFSFSKFICYNCL